MWRLSQQERLAVAPAPAAALGLGLRTQGVRALSIVRWIAFALAVCLAAIMPVAAEPAEILDLGDGYRFELLGAGETGSPVGNPKVVFINVAVSDDKIHADHKRTIEAADRMFEAVVMHAAEKGLYQRATVNLRKAGAKTYEAFTYARGADGVWLRQAGQEKWKTAQSASWTPPKSKSVEVKGHGTFAVEAAIDIKSPPGFKRAAEIDFVTKSKLSDVQRKYAEIKALWAQMDREKLKADGYDMIVFGNFSEPPRGRFHPRQGFFVRIPRGSDGAWPALPDRAPDNRELLISKNEIPAEQLALVMGRTFASGLDTLRLTEVIAPPLPDASASAATLVGFGPAAPVITFDNPIQISIPNPELP